jgi:hypothetical protein
VLFERAAQTTVTAPWPSASDRALVGGVIDGYTFAPKAVFALLDTSQPRFVLGAMDAGFGIVSMLVPDGSGRMLALLPWSGELVRVSLRCQQPRESSLRCPEE